MTYHREYLPVTKATMRAHRARWYVKTGVGSDSPTGWLPHTASMRGAWPGYDVECSCGWRSATGGGVRADADAGSHFRHPIRDRS